MQRRPVRACLSILLVFTLLSLLPPRTVMASPLHASMQTSVATKGMTHEMHALGHHESRMTDTVASSGSVSDTNGHATCHCNGHCGVCGACSSVLPSTMTIAFAAANPISIRLQLSILTEISFSPDPRPPRV